DPERVGLTSPGTPTGQRDVRSTPRTGLRLAGLRKDRTDPNETLRRGEARFPSGSPSSSAPGHSRRIGNESFLVCAEGTRGGKRQRLSRGPKSGWPDRARKGFFDVEEHLRRQP